MIIGKEFKGSMRHKGSSTRIIPVGSDALIKKIDSDNDVWQRY
jgi:hypothetical protein